MILFEMIIYLTLGFCLGGLVNEMYRRKHPYQSKVSGILYGYRVTSTASEPAVAQYEPVYQADWSPNRRLTDAEWRAVAEGDAQR